MMTRMWRGLPVGIIVCLPLGWLAFHCATTRVAAAENAKADGGAKACPLVTISKETTYITAPLAADGYPDYLAALNQKSSEGVTSENNAVVPLMQALGPGIIDNKHRPQFFKMLGIAPLPEKGDYYVDIDAYLEKHNPEALKDRRDAKGQYQSPRWLSEDRRASRPWRKDDCPLIAAWLAANEKPLALVVEASRRPRFYIPSVGVGTWFDMKGAFDAVSLRTCGILRHALTKRVMLEIGKGDVEESWSDLLAGRRLGRQVNWLICGNSRGLTVEQISYWECWQLAYSRRITPEAAKKYWADIAKLPPRPSGVALIAEGGRCEYLDRICAALRRPEKAADIFGEQRFSLLITGLTNDKAKPNVSLPVYDVPNYELAKFIAGGKVDWDRVLRLGNEHFDKIAAVDRLPNWKQKSDALDALQRDVVEQLKAFRSKKSAKSAAPANGQSEEDEKSKKTRWFSAECLANYLSYDGGGHGMPWVKLREDTELTIQRELTRVSFALSAYRTEHHEYPATLFALIPKFLDRVPNDPYGTGRYRYRRKDEGYLLYSVGMNGVDDGGPRPWEGSVPPELEKSDDYGIRVPDYFVEREE
jgi:hypothetical protein